ncbi:multidrug/spermidine efflux SMR transporter subunit MdtI [Arsenophonus sp.]|uniref:multidrug/spermidine efflux SMR transporter subunit MdtI n=1 Tax=Arsenophonus sp. TaxID=1872640 RepID=UPI00387A6025
MLAEYQWWHGSFLFLAVILEIVANIFLKLSNGFKRLWIGVLSLIAVLGAFSALAVAVKGIELSIAYALWGAFGVVATVAAGWILFNQRLNYKGWGGIILLIIGMVVIKLA